MVKRALIYIVAIVAIVGCFKDESYDSLLVFRPAQQLASGDEFIDLEGVVIYSYIADTTDYVPQSYSDALAGVVTNKTTGVTLSPAATGEAYEGYFTYTYEIEEDDDEDDEEEEEEEEEVIYPYADGEVVECLITGISLRATLPQIMLVAVDTVNEGYAYCNYDVGLNLPITYITISFRPWKTAPFEQGFWQYVVPIVEEEEEESTEEETETETEEETEEEDQTTETEEETETE